MLLLFGLGVFGVFGFVIWYCAACCAVLFLVVLGCVGFARRFGLCFIGCRTGGFGSLLLRFVVVDCVLFGVTFLVLVGIGWLGWRLWVLGCGLWFVLEAWVCVCDCCGDWLWFGLILRLLFVFVSWYCFYFLRIVIWVWFGWVIFMYSGLVIPAYVVLLVCCCH